MIAYKEIRIEESPELLRAVYQNNVIVMVMLSAVPREKAYAMVADAVAGWIHARLSKEPAPGE